MNRIILIGNGFDLAHGMKTGYSDFLNDLWINIIEEIQMNQPYQKFENDEIIIDKIPENWTSEKNYLSLKESVKNVDGKLQFKNRFLQHITNKKHIENWVDIEDEYYKLLKKSYEKVEYTLI